MELLFGIFSAILRVLRFAVYLIQHHLVHIVLRKICSKIDVLFVGDMPHYIFIDWWRYSSTIIFIVFVYIEYIIMYFLCKTTININIC